MRRANMRRIPVVVLVILVVGLAPLSAATIIGQTGTNGVLLDGQKVPSGTTLLSDSVVKTGDSAAVVHLNSGRLVWLGGQSQVLFETADTGLAIHVQAGTVAYNAGASGVLTLVPNSVLMLNAQGQVQEGTRVRGDVGICDLRNADTGQYFTSQGDVAQCHAKPGGNQCAWNQDQVSNSELQEFLDRGAVRLGENSKIDKQCEGGGGAGFWPIAAAVAGGVGVGYLIFDDDEDHDDLPCASPITPDCHID